MKDKLKVKELVSESIKVEFLDEVVGFFNVYDFFESFKVSVK